MVVSMVSDDMSFFMHSFDQIRARGDKVTDNEECCGRFVFLQCVEDGRRIAGLVAAVEGPIQFFFFCVFGVVGIIFFQFV